jgi:hypothetical protein
MGLEDASLKVDSVLNLYLYPETGGLPPDESVKDNWREDSESYTGDKTN